MNGIKRSTLLAICLLSLAVASLAGFRLAQGQGAARAADFIAADSPDIQYTGRVDFADPKMPRFTAPGVYVTARFKGTYCDVVVNDEVLYGKSHNYLEIVVDDRRPVRIKLTEATNTIRAVEGLPNGTHTIVVCKDTESGIGALTFVGFRCDGLRPPPPRPARRLEFIGDSITCGAGSDTVALPCGKGQWYDQHNAYLSYGPTAARRLHAQWQLTSVSGIGLIHSCCGMTVTMPDVYDKMDFRTNAGAWDFQRYQPDAVTVCLGQNDGPANPAAFQDAYVRFIGALRSHYPSAQIVCLTSPMGDANLTAVMKDDLTKVVARVNAQGDAKVHTFFFSRSFNDGCGGHPDVAQHQLIAGELSTYLKSALGW